MKLREIPKRDEITTIHEQIKPYIIRTPILSSRTVNETLGCEVFFKCENFQPMGAFKMRGATAAALSLPSHERARGLATHSSGNHGQAVALTAKNLGLKAYIVMPENAPRVKREAVIRYGAEVTLCENTLESRESTLRSVIDKTGAAFLHPYNNYDVIAGQATAAREVLQDIPDLDHLLAPIGGGGLVSGTLLTTHYWNPSTEVIGAEPKVVDDAFRSWKADRIQTNATTDTIADGLRTNLGEYTFDIIRKYVSDIVTVSEESIISAMRFTWERLKITIETSSAVPVAAVMDNPSRFAGKKVGIIVSGGNVDLSHLPWQ